MHDLQHELLELKEQAIAPRGREGGRKGDPPRPLRLHREVLTTLSPDELHAVVAATPGPPNLTPWTLCPRPPCVTE